MNHTQTKYALARAKSILRAKQEAITGTFRSAKVELTDEQRCKALKAGEFTMRKSEGRYDYWHNRIVFYAEVLPDTKGEKKALATLAAAFTKLEDALVLGDSSEALVLLANFEAA